MLTEERYAKILNTVRQNRSVKLPELCEMLNASESTVRRDLSALDERGLIKKVHGGAISTDDRSLNLVEYDVESKSKLFTEANAKAIDKGRAIIATIIPEIMSFTNCFLL